MAWNNLDPGVRSQVKTAVRVEMICSSVDDFVFK